MGEEKPDKIFPSFYIGSMEAATDLDQLYDYDITHIITVATGIKPKWPRKFKYLALDVLDMDDCDIKQHFQKTFEFIEKGRSDGSVLVHCVAGVSRSATICAAYIMKKLRVGIDDAIGLVKDARPSICPNDGFMKQLRAYERELGLTNLPSETTQEDTQQVNQPQTDTTATPSDSTSLPASTSSSTPIESDFPSTQSLDAALPHPNTITDTAKSRFCCRMCGSYLFNDTELVLHDPGSGQTSFDWHKRANSGQIECTSYFLQEPEQFGDTSDLVGKLTCPKCNSRFGSWQWAGAQCSCGVWVTPAFQVPKARVDAKPIIK